MSTLGPTITTDRLVLHPPNEGDFDAFATLVADPTAMHMIGGPQVRAVAWRTFMTMAGSWAIYGFGFFMVRERSSGRVVGRIGTHRPDGWPGTEVGWALHGDAQGMGYATEAAAAAMDFAFDRLGWSEVIHCIDPLNEPSMAVARRLGSQVLREAWLPEPISHTTVCWGQSTAQWRARRQ
jgi:RimJ/RimL family protein N-acetyltransferase